MGATLYRNTRRSVITLATMYAAQADDEFIIPDDLTAVSDEELASLHEQALANFDQMYGDGVGLSDEDFQVLSDLTEGIERLTGELSSREAAATERAEAAAELAARIRPRDEAPEATEELAGDESADEGSGEQELSADTSVTEADDSEGGEESVTASSAVSPIRVPMSRVRSRATRLATTRATDGDVSTIRDVMTVSGDGLGRPVGVGVTFEEAGQMLDRRLGTFNTRQYESAARSRNHIREQQAFITLRRPIPEDLQIRSNDPDHVREVFDRAGDEKRLPQGSLTASGGWCAPSEVLYDIVGEVESREGLLSLPEIGVPRGGVSFSTGPDFRDLFRQVSENAFHFTEQDDIDGKYQASTPPARAAETSYSAGDEVSVSGAVLVAIESGTSGEGSVTPPTEIGGTVVDGSVTWERLGRSSTNVVGDKPCFRIDCEPFEEHRLDVDGLCVTAGILQQRGFPELQSRSIRGVLVAHDHLINGRMIRQMVAGSTPVNFPAPQAGATAPLLTAIEVQVEHYKASRRMPRGTTVEGVFPYWVLGAIRADLARRQGVDLIDVPDSRILAWFRNRGVNPQFVYNWQGIDTRSAATATSFPSTVKFLLYQAGTWIRGASDLITLDTLYDSVLLGQNDYTALFTEEGWFVAKRGQESRVVTVPFDLPGAVAAAQDIQWNGTVS